MGFVASARRLCPLGPLRTRAGSTVRYAMQGKRRVGRRGGGEKEGRGIGGRGEGGRSRGGEKEERGDEGTGRRKSLGLLVVRQQELG